jgi:hypothetical protein
MNSDYEIIPRWAWDNCPPDWLAKDARQLLAGGKPRWAHEKDPGVLEYVAYLRQLAAAEAEGQPLAIDGKILAMHFAHDLAERKSPLRQRIESEILAGRSDQEIAAICHLDARIIHCYAKLFFDVRDRLRTANARSIPGNFEKRRIRVGRKDSLSVAPAHYLGNYAPIGPPFAENSPAIAW